MPEKIGGFYMAALTTKPDVVEFFKILSNETQVGISIEELIFDDIAPKPNAPRTIRDLDIRNTGANLIGIKTPDGRYLINPSPDTIIEARMCLIALGTPRQIEELKAYCQQQYKNTQISNKTLTNKLIQYISTNRQKQQKTKQKSQKKNYPSHNNRHRYLKSF